LFGCLHRNDKAERRGRRGSAEVAEEKRAYASI
jgi:hypothetical protein